MASLNTSGSSSARMRARAGRPSPQKRAPSGALFMSTAAILRAGLALSPGRVAASDVVAGWQRHAGFQPFELDPGAGAGAQQSVGGFAQSRPAPLRVFCQRRVKCREEGGDVAVHPGSQVFVDIRTGALLAMGPIGTGLLNRTVISSGPHLRKARAVGAVAAAIRRNRVVVQSRIRRRSGAFAGCLVLRLAVLAVADEIVPLRRMMFGRGGSAIAL